MMYSEKNGFLGFLNHVKLLWQISRNKIDGRELLPSQGMVLHLFIP